MKVYLTYPPTSFNTGWGGFLPFPMAPICLASYLIQHGVDTKIYHRQPYDLKALSTLIKKYKPDIIGMTCDSSNSNACFKISHFVKKIDRDILVVLGGIHATFFDQLILKKESAVDVIVRGEGEIALLEIAERYQKDNKGSFCNIQGITFRSNNRIFRNVDRCFIDDMDSLPFLNYDLIDMKKIESYTFPGWWPLHTARGCCFRCKYCSDVGFWKRTYRYKSPERVFNEIRLCRDRYGSRGFFFNDLTFTTNKKRIFDLCRILAENRTQVKWGCYTRIDCVDRDLLKAMTGSGCKMVVYGVESFSNKMLKLMGKGHSTELAIKILNTTNSLGIDTRFELLLGFPGETRETLTENIENLKQLDKGVTYNNINIFQLHPGSIVYNAARKSGLIDDEAWFSGFRMEKFVHIFYPASFIDLLKKTAKKIESFFKKEYEAKENTPL